MLPPAPSTGEAGCHPAISVLSDEELHREYAVVLDALNHSCCLAQIATESPGIHTGIHPITDRGIVHQSGIPSCGSAGAYWQTCCSASGLETCVDDSLCAEDDLMVSSWTGLSGVPGLGVSVPTRPGKNNYLLHMIHRV